MNGNSFEENANLITYLDFGENIKIQNNINSFDGPLKPSTMRFISNSIINCSNESLSIKCNDSESSSFLTTYPIEGKDLNTKNRRNLDTIIVPKKPILENIISKSDDNKSPAPKIYRKSVNNNESEDE